MSSSGALALLTHGREVIPTRCNQLNPSGRLGLSSKVQTRLKSSLFLNCKAASWLGKRGVRVHDHVEMGALLLKMTIYLLSCLIRT